MKKTFVLFLLLAGFTMLFTQSCRKHNDPLSEDNDLFAAEDDAYSESVFADAFNMMDEAARENEGFNKNGLGEHALLNGCAQITVDTNANPRKMTIDFGTGCVGKDGRTRTGKIIVTFTGRYRTPGTVIKFTFDNYTVNGHKVEGSKTVTNMGEKSNGNLYFKIEVTGSKITTEHGTITRNSTREREWIAGRNTPEILDDQYEITGSASGTNRKGTKYEMTIKTPLLIKIGCRWITKGSIEVKPEDKPLRTVDYGNGDCDNQATVKIGNRSHTIQMR